jgi:hypothetical protein
MHQKIAELNASEDCGITDKSIAKLKNIKAKYK